MSGSRQHPRRPRSSRDYGLIGLVGVLLLIGVLVIYTISPALSFRTNYGPNFYVLKHIGNIAVAILGFIFASRLSIDNWRSVMPWLLGATILTSLMLLIPAVSVTAYGATRWISIAGVSFQPAELLKFVIILYLGFILGSRSNEEIKDMNKTLIPLSVLLGVVGVLLVIIQRDLGTMIVVTIITLGLMYFRGVPLLQLAGLSGVLGALAGLSVIAFPHRLERVLTFLNSNDDPLGASYHVNQALNGIGSGGLFGQGLGRSVQVYGYLPEAENDSVFAIMGEIFGFFGTLIVLILFAVLVGKLITIAKQQTDVTRQMIAIGVALWIFSHIVINVGAMLSIMPLTGITLPFLSLGGSSLLLMMTGLGVAFRLSGETQSSIRHRVAGRTASRRQPAIRQSPVTATFWQRLLSSKS